MSALVASAGGSAAIVVLAVLLLYFLPTIAAYARKVPNIGSVAVINVFLGWTFIGWVVALAMAFRSRPSTAAGAPSGPTAPALPSYQASPKDLTPKRAGCTEADCCIHVGRLPKRSSRSERRELLSVLRLTCCVAAFELSGARRLRQLRR